MRMSKLIGFEKYENYKNTLIKHGYVEKDFELSTKPTPPSNIEYQLKSEIIVKFTKTGVERSYKAGHGYHWIADFERDLNRGIFKNK
jgi:hypothetical protein